MRRKGCFFILLFSILIVIYFGKKGLYAPQKNVLLVGLFSDNFPLKIIMRRAAEQHFGVIQIYIYNYMYIYDNYGRYSNYKNNINVIWLVSQKEDWCRLSKNSSENESFVSKMILIMGR